MNEVGFVRRIWCRLEYVAGTFMKEVLFLDSLTLIMTIMIAISSGPPAACVMHVFLFFFPHSVHWPFLS